MHPIPLSQNSQHDKPARHSDGGRPPFAHLIRNPCTCPEESKDAPKRNVEMIPLGRRREYTTFMLQVGPVQAVPERPTPVTPAVVRLSVRLTLAS